ncbi:MAG: cupin domain-containing protein [Polyangiales bacterium]|nr:cupin domain-containing protein [Myxococcales bacterium]MCB9658038.1 cupin domain-containing protein [Sandaracinaceae bacterium]
MPVLPAPSDWTHELPHARFRSLATPARGSRETSVWRVWLAPGVDGTPHRVTREEVFIVLEGRVACATEGSTQFAAAGDAIVTPVGVDFTIAAVGDAPAELLCCLPVGGQAQFGSGEPFTPPWAV